MKSLIFCAAGVPMSFHKDYDPENHWRYTKDTRMYETVVYQYKDFNMESNSYDHLFKSTGWKWEIAKQFLDTFDYSGYEYIGFLDDDLVTDIQSINRAITTAKEKDIKLFQLSLNDDSEKQHSVTFQDRSIKFALTNFVEGMGPFVHASLMPAFVEFWKYHEVKSGWGFDIVMSSILKAKTAVMHEVSMHHVPKHNPYYDKSAAFAEMYDIMNNVYPKFMKGYYNEEVEAHKEDQKVLGFSFNTV